MVQGVAFDGMATGMETDEIIQQLMEIERQSIVRQQQDIQEIEQEKEVWQEINQNLVGFDNTVESLNDEDLYQGREAISGNEEVMTIDAEPGAQPATYRDVEVDQLARPHTVRATTHVSDLEVPDAENVETADDELGLDGSFLLGESDEPIEVDPEDTLNDIRDTINQESTAAHARVMSGYLLIDAEESGVENQLHPMDVEGGILDSLEVIDAETDDLTRIGMEEHIENTEVSAEDVDEPLEDYTGESFEILDETFELEEDTTLEDLQQEINSRESLSATIIGGRLVIDGDGQEIEANDIDDSDSGLLDDLGIINGDDNPNYLQEIQDEDSPQNANFTIDGIDFEESANTNIEITDNVTVDLLRTNREEEEPFNLEVREDTEAIEETIDQFIDSYNEVQTYLSEMTGEEEMLQGDVTARRLQSSLRSAVMNTVQDIGDVNEDIFSLGEMGIEIDAAGTTGDFEGIMSIADEGDFSQALEQNMDEVQNLFLGDEEAGVDGLIERIDEQVSTYMAESVTDRGIVGNRKDNLDNEIGRIEDSIAREERRMERREQRLREQFTQMEVAVYEAQQQQQQVMNMTQQLGATGLSDMMM